MEVDRLSALPARLRLDIIRRLGSKEAVKTAVLSRRWRFFCSDLPFCFHDTSKDIEAKRSFAASVHAALAVRGSRAVERLSVEFFYDGRLASDVDSWLDFAAKNRVKKVYLRLLPDYDNFRLDRYELPQVIYSSSSLTALTVENCIIASVKTPVEWRCLKTLWLKFVEIRQETIRVILSGCPLLENLFLDGCRGFDRLEIGSASFHCLSVTYFSDDLLEIWAPYMKQLHLEHLDDLDCTSIGRRMVRLENVESLEYAGFDLFVRPWASTSLEAIRTAMEKYLHLGRDIREIGLRSGFSQALSIMATYGWRFPQPIRAEVLSISGASISGVVAMLESCPFVQELVLNCYVPGEEEQEKEAMFQESIDWGPIRNDDLSCDLMHLKTVKFEDYCDASDSGEPTFTMAKILLKRAPLLEKMVIYKTDCFSTEVYEDMKNALIQSPKSSHKASIEIQ